MIGYVKGTVKLKAPPIVVIEAGGEAGGLGYEIEAPMSTFYDLPDVGKSVTLHTHFVVRDDAQLLYGFTKTRDRDLFRQVLKVNGVGPRMGLAILSSMTTDEFLGCVQASDVASMTRIPGVGKKTAERLLVDLRDRLESFGAAAADDGGANAAGGDRAVQDAISALESLGYRPADATKTVRAVKGKDLGTEALIREALKMLAS